MVSMSNTKQEIYDAYTELLENQPESGGSEIEELARDFVEQYETAVFHDDRVEADNAYERLKEAVIT